MTADTDTLLAPWTIVPANEHHGFYIENAGGKTVCDLYHINRMNGRVHHFMNAQENAIRIQRIPAMISALTKAEEAFRHYGDLHAAKPDMEKANRNYALAEEIRQVLKGMEI